MASAWSQWLHALWQSCHKSLSADVSSVSCGGELWCRPYPPYTFRVQTVPFKCTDRLRTFCSRRAAAEKEEKHCWGSLQSWTCNQVTSLLAAYKSERGSVQCTLMWGRERNRGGRGQLKSAHTHTHKGKKGRTLIMKCIRPLHIKERWSHFRFRWESKHLSAVLNRVLFSAAATSSCLTLHLEVSEYWRSQIMAYNGNK